MNYDKEQLNEQKSIDRWMAWNTVFTILAGVTNTIIAIIGLWIAFKK